MTDWNPPDVSMEAFEKLKSYELFIASNAHNLGLTLQFCETWGAYMRYQQPTHFGSLYNDWLEAKRRNGEITYQCEECGAIEAGDEESLPEGWKWLDGHTGMRFDYPPKNMVVCESCFNELVDNAVDDYNESDVETAEEWDSFVEDMGQDVYEEFIERLGLVIHDLD